jgi:hypothetical protein
MKIAYLAHWNQGAMSGVYKKIVQQTNLWNEMGHPTNVFLLTNNCHLEAPTDSLPWQIVNYNQYSRLSGWHRIAMLISKWKPDYIYHRYDLYYPALIRLMDLLPTVIEINTNDYYEYGFSNLRGLYNRLFRSRVISRAAGLVFVTAELSLDPVFAKYERPSCVIPNGILLEDIIKCPAPSAKGVRMIMIGSNGQPWHGMDKVLALAKLRPAWLFDIVGYEGETELKNVRFWGKLGYKDYKSLLNVADFGIGSLALYRIKMNEGSPIKVREYLAAGLPSIIGYIDSDFPEGAPFLLRLPNDKENIIKCLGLIDEFVSNWKSKRVERQSIKIIDSRNKERQRLEFCRHLIDR